MKWKIKIINRPEQRIIINYLPLDNSVRFVGQYQPKNNLIWVDFIEINVQDFNQEKFLPIIESITDSLDRKINDLNNLNDFFKTKLEIEINDNSK